MSRSVLVRLLLACSLLALLAGCTRDPNVRKQKFLASGDQYFAKQEYKAAIIQYSNALKLDPRYEPARYRRPDGAAETDSARTGAEPLPGAGTFSHR